MFEEEEKISRMQCSVEKCDENYKKETLKCDDCKCLVHYSCTQLTEYQLLLFDTNGYNGYLCFNCIARDFNCVARENTISKSDFIVDRDTKIDELNQKTPLSFLNVGSYVSVCLSTEEYSSKDHTDESQKAEQVYGKTKGCDQKQRQRLEIGTNCKKWKNCKQ